MGINHEEYLRSVGPEQLIGNMVLGNLSSLSELSSEGKSGAFFYYTIDGNLVLKTISYSEKRAILDMLPDYYKYLNKYPQSMLIRFLGLHSLETRRSNDMKGKMTKVTKKRNKVYFIVM